MPLLKQLFEKKRSLTDLQKSGENQHCFLAKILMFWSISKKVHH